MSKNKPINLLPQEEFDASVLGRTLRWAMGTFRIIVIVTEMVVMSAFLSRFWLDAENSNLSNSIKIATSQIEVQSQFEKDFRILQSKLAIFKGIVTGNKQSSKVRQIAVKTPLEVVVTSISVQDTKSEVKGIASSEVNVAQFISNLLSDPTIKRAELGSLASSPDTQSQTVFSINISY